MLLHSNARASTKEASSKHNTVAAPQTAPRKGMPRGVAATRVGPAANTDASGTPPATKTASPDRSARAEALVRHVTQLPTFLAWAAATSVSTSASTSPRVVAQYLEERVAEVAAQLDSLQHAGDYTRLVVLLTELLHGDMAAGVTPRMIESGLLRLLSATATAVASGKRATLPTPVSVPFTSPGHTFSATAKRAASAHSGTVLLASQSTAGGGGAPTMPIESLLPPLIDQTVRKPKPALEGFTIGGMASLPEQTEDEAEMEAWENYMATVRVATTTADAPHAHGSATNAADGTGVSAGPHASEITSSVAAEHACVIQSLPDALCALVASCTAAPFISLTLQDQQSERAAVASVAGGLIAVAAKMPAGAAELSVVRLTAIEGLYLLLSTYIGGSRGGGGGGAAAANGTGSQAGIWKSVQPSKARSKAVLTSAPPAVLLDSAELAAMLHDITLDWAHILTRLSAASSLGESAGAGQQEKNDSSEEDQDDEEVGVAAAAAASVSSGAVGELNWVLEIALLLLHAQQHVLQRVGSPKLPAPHHVLPRQLLPVVLRTMALLPTTPALSSRAVTYSRQCVDVLWTATLLAPVAASRQLLYGSLPASDDRPTGDEANSPAVDFFVALLYQFNEAHSLAHREMRDDLVTLLALLLRCDRQFVEDVLVARRGAADGAADVADDARGEVGGSPAIDDAAVAKMTEAATDDGCTPLSLSCVTVEAINAVVALIFETTCGAELGAGALPNTLNSRGGNTNTGASAGEEARPSALLSEEAVRSYALRFQSVTISAARRREVVEFKKYGWQLLGAHCEWQLAHLTFREYVNLHEPAAATASAATSGQGGHHHHHERSSPIPQVTGEAARDEEVTTALWGMQLSRLGYFDVLLLYVDMDSSVPAVVAWTREELMLLEQEAWQLFTSMILFTQHLDAVAGGIRVRRRRCYAPASFSHASAAAEERGSRSNGLSGASISAGEEDDAGDDDDAGGGVLYGADIHFIAAGGVDVALRFLTAAPAEMEAVKRSALVTLAAIARTSSSGEAHLHSGSYTVKDLALVRRALTEYAPTLVPFLVRIIREVDAHVDATGMPAAAPPLITTSAAATALRDADMEGTCVSTALGEASAEAAAHTVARWGWLPYSAGVTVVFAWCLLRSIGDVVLSEVGMVRELPDLSVDFDKQVGGSSEEGVVDAENDRSSSIRSFAHTAQHSAQEERCSNGSFPPPEQGLESTGILLHYAGEAAGDGEVQLHAAGMDASVVADDHDDLSSSGYSMGPPPGEEAAAATTAAAPAQSAGGWRAASPRSRLRAAAPKPLFVSTGPNTSSQNIPDADISSGDCQARRRTLLRSVHEDVLLIPEMFAAEGGVDALVVWIRHTLRLCLSARAQAAQWIAQASPHQRVPLPRLTVEEVAELEFNSDLFLLLLDVFRAIVLGSEGNEELFVRSGGVHGLLDVIEAYALAHGLISRAAAHARNLAADLAATTFAQSFTSSCSPSATAGRKGEKGVLRYAMTLLSDLLDNCPCALDEFATWHSRHIFTSPLTPDVQECWAGSKGVEAVQLLLCLWAADLPARGGSLNEAAAAASTGTGLELLRLHLRPALRMALKEEYVCRLLRRRAKMGALEAETIRGYYRYIHAASSSSSSSAAAVTTGEEVTDAVVLAYMEHIMLGHRKRNAVPAEQQIALLVNNTLGLCLKVYGCLAAVGFDSLHAAETETPASPSLRVNLSSLERSFLVQIAALPALCVDEISTAMAEVALGTGEERACRGVVDRAMDGGDVAAWRPTTPDRKTLSNAAAESATRASELDQIIEVGAQVQQARQEQLYHRYLVTQLRQPVAPPADGRPGAVKGTWKTQRRLSTTVGGLPITDTSAAAASGSAVRAGEYAVELAARLSTRLAAEEQQLQQHIAATVLAKSTGRRTLAVDEGSGSERLMSTAPPALGSGRTPYPALMGSVHAAAATDRPPATTFVVSSPPRRPAAPLTERHQKRQAMIARSVRKAPLDAAGVKDGRKL